MRLKFFAGEAVEVVLNGRPVPAVVEVDGGRWVTVLATLRSGVVAWCWIVVEKVRPSGAMFGGASQGVACVPCGLPGAVKSAREFSHMGEAQ